MVACDVLVERLLRFAETRSSRPGAPLSDDRRLLMVSRCRERLSHGFRGLVAEAELVEDLTDKARFHALAERLARSVQRAASPLRARAGAVQRALRPRSAAFPA